jgi:cell division septation protein DedD
MPINKQHHAISLEPGIRVAQALRVKMRKLMGCGMVAVALSGATVLSIGGARADVKAGVDAWSRGDYRKAVEEWRRDAVAGDPDAQFNLGQAYKLGRGVPVDPVLAEQWYGKAAAQGHPQAIDSYGLALFQNGKREEAVPWLEKSVARGEPRAQLVLGTMLFNGDIIKKDWVRAYALMVRSSAAGLPQGSQTLAQMDQYIPLDTRQQGLALARQYEASASELQSQPEVAGQGSPGSIRGTELPASMVSDENLSNSVNAPLPSKYPQPKPVPPKPVMVAKAKPVPVAPPVETAVTPVRATTGKGWRIQFGAFRDTGNAHGLWQQLSGRVGSLAGLQPKYPPMGALTALQVGPLPARADAARVCGEVKARVPGTPCVIIEP